MTLYCVVAPCGEDAATVYYGMLLCSDCYEFARNLPDHYRGNPVALEAILEFIADPAHDDEERQDLTLMDVVQRAINRYETMRGLR